MKTKYKILIAKILSKLITFFISRKQKVVRNKIRWNLDLEEGIDLSVYLFGTSYNLVMLIKDIKVATKSSLCILQKNIFPLLHKLED